VGPDRDLWRRALRQRGPRDPYDGHDRRWRPRRPAAGHRRRARGRVDRGQGLRGPQLQRGLAPLRGPVRDRPDRPRGEQPRSGQAPRHRQQLVGQRRPQ
jgi:hypothetical protein